MILAAVSAPGGFSVPPLHGWESIALALAAVVVVGLLFLLVLAAGAARTGRRGSPEWQAWLDARTRERHDVPGPGGPQGS